MTIFLSEKMPLVKNRKKIFRAILITPAIITGGSILLGPYFKLLFRWEGSIYKLVLFDLVLYICLYYAINLTYRFTLGDKPGDHLWKWRFHQIVAYCKRATKDFPLQFVLGFYVTQVVTRWWNQFLRIPWPDSLAIIAATCIRGHDERGRLMRRTFMRYVNLCLIFTFVSVSPQCRSRFPALEHLVEAGFLLPHEKLIIDHLNEQMEGPKYFVPLVWAGAIGARARKEGRIADDVALFHMVREICKFRLGAQDLLSYDWVNIPLVYTQVVTLAVYIYFLAALVGKQMTGEDGRVDLYVPVFQFLEFFFLMGWLKVAEDLINPFGDDDDDFEVNWLIDRNIMVSYMIVDEMNMEFPEMVKDSWWDRMVPYELFYTEKSLRYKKDGYVGSAEVALSPRCKSHHHHAKFLQEVLAHAPFVPKRTDSDAGQPLHNHLTPRPKPHEPPTRYIWFKDLDGPMK